MAVRRTGIPWQLLAFLVLAHLFSAGSCSAAEFHNALSLQGFTGLLNTPNAEVTDEGKVYLLYSNQQESQWRNRPSEESYMFSLGFFSFLEIGGRLTEAWPAVRDLSANAKLRLPFSVKSALLPDVAFGMQDLGGGARNLQTKYAVATEKLGPLHLSLGYGTGPDRMDGLFGGVEFQAFDWLCLIGEHDTLEKNLGVRMVAPQLLGTPVDLQFTAKTSLDDRFGDLEFGLGMQIPLGLDEWKKLRQEERAALAEKAEPERTATRAESSGAGQRAPGHAVSNAMAGGMGARVADGTPSDPPTTRMAADRVPVREEGEETSETPGPLPAGGGISPFGAGDPSMKALRDKLAAGGFLNVQVGANREKALLVVEYENVRYNDNELDGLGIVAGLATDTASPDFEILQLILKKKGIPVLQVRAAFSDLREFFHGPPWKGRYIASLDVTTEVKAGPAVHFLDGGTGSSWLASELILYPGLKTYVGTEVGLFDYLLSLKPDYYLNLWKGAVLNARWDIPVIWTENFDNGKSFRGARKGSRMDQLMFFQAAKLTPTVMVNVGAGMVFHEDYGMVNELQWTPGNGNHRFSLKQAYLTGEKEDAVPYPDNKVFLGSYRYFFAPLDLYLTGTVGQFLDQDRGFTVELKRFFGDTAISFYYRNSRTDAKPGLPSENVQMGGIQVSLPLTFRREMKTVAKIQVKGNNDWAYSQEVKIVTPGSTNNVDTSVGVDPQMPYNLQHIYGNRDRLTEDYIWNHLPRLRDAYLTYRD